jgi:hypothetical protein
MASTSCSGRTARASETPGSRFVSGMTGGQPLRWRTLCMGPRQIATAKPARRSAVASSKPLSGSACSIRTRGRCVNGQGARSIVAGSFQKREPPNTTYPMGESGTA